MTQVLSAALGLSLLAAGQSAQISVGEDPASLVGSKAMAASWRNTVQCGRNCVCGFLRLHGVNIDLASVQQSIPLTERGATLLSMQQAARASGLDCSAYRVPDLEQLRGFQMPVIAHIDTREGHYILLLDVAAGSVTVADLSSCEISEIPATRFKEDWSGYVLAPTARPRWPWIVGVGLVLGFTCGALCYRLIALLVRRR